MNIEQFNLNRFEWEDLIDKWIFDEQDRAILKRKLLDGRTFEQVAEEFELSSTAVKNKVYKSSQTLIKHIESEKAMKERKHFNFGIIRFSPETEDGENTLYICTPFKRFIFRNGKYAGWYKP